MPDRIITRNATYIQAIGDLADKDGNALDLTGLPVTYTLRNASTGELLIDKAVATIANQVTYPGRAVYDYDASEVVDSGVFHEEWEVDHGSGAVEKFPVEGVQIVIIKEDVSAY